MEKIPVGKTIADAYRFAFGDFRKILSIIWLPWLVLTAGGVVLRSQTLAFSNAIATRNYSGLSHALTLLVPFYIVAVIVLFMQVAGITQQALGLRTGSPYYYVSLGKPVWRLIGTFLLVAAIFAGSYIMLLAAGILLGAVVAILAKIANSLGIILGIVAVIAMIAAFGAYFYCLVRVAFLLNPIVIAEQRISLRRSWALGAGNFWRIVAILLAVMLPIMTVQILIMFVFLGHGFPPTAPIHATADQLAANRALVAAWNADLQKRMLDYWYLVYPAYALIAALFYGLGCGAQCFAYRALVPKAPSASPL